MVKKRSLENLFKKLKDYRPTDKDSRKNINVAYKKIAAWLNERRENEPGPPGDR